MGAGASVLAVTVIVVGVQESRRGAVESATKEAVEAEGLGPRDVCPLLRIRVASLLSPAMKRKIEEGGQRQVEGVITIWRPSEEQVQPHKSIAKNIV